jgi:TnpA family transposase
LLQNYGNPFISNLQAYPRQNVLTRALQEYGRLVKTLFILRYLLSADYRRRINSQLNKGEALHALRDFLFVGDKRRFPRSKILQQSGRRRRSFYPDNGLTCDGKVDRFLVRSGSWRKGF